MVKEEVHFNLLDEQWIQIQRLDGRADTVSMRVLLSHSPSIRTISGELPQMYFSQLRLALAIVYRAYGVAYDFSEMTSEDLIEMWCDIWQQKSFDDDVLADYFDRQHDNFDLFDPVHPFFQTAGLQYSKGGESPINVLMPDVPKQDKTLFTMRSLAYADSLGFAEAARFLVLTQAFDVAGIKGAVEGNTKAKAGKVYAPKGLSGTGWCGNLGGTFLEGRSLFETIMLNWVLYSNDANTSPILIGRSDDAPAWERSDGSSDMVNRTPTGVVDLLTWQSRRIRLVLDEAGEAVAGLVSCYGDITSPVELQGVETMTPWRRSKAQQKNLNLSFVPRMPKPHVSGRSLWRGLSSMLAIEDNGSSQGDDLRPSVIKWAEQLRHENALPGDYPLALRAQGMEYGTQASVFVDSVDDFVDMDAILLGHDAPATRNVLEIISLTDQAVGAFVQFSVSVLASTGDRRRFDKFDDKAAGGVKEDARSLAYDRLDGLFRKRIAGLNPEVNLAEYRSAWERETKTLLLRLANEQMQVSNASYFSGPDGKTAGLAFSRFKRKLNGIFEWAGISEGSSASERKGDHSAIN